MNRLFLKMKKIIVLSISFLVLISTHLFAQSTSYSLEKVIDIAQKNSLEIQIAKFELISNYWAYRTFKRGLLPQLNFSGELPNLNRSFTKYTNPDGTESYLGQSYVSYSGNLQIKKTLGFTGGDVFLSSGLQRIDNFTDSTRSHNFLSTPINLGISQPIFNYNPYKWSKKIEPLKYQEAKRKYLESSEQVRIIAVNYYFDLLNAQLNVEIQDVNVQNYDTLYKMAKGRYSLGKIQENELLQLELQLLQSKASLELANLNYENTLYKFRSFLRLSPDAKIMLEEPKSIDFIIVDKENALNYALVNNSTMLSYDRQVMQANSNLDRAKKENGFNANLYAVFGLTQNAPILNEAYQDPYNQQNVRLGLQVPIYDWGLRKGQVKMAESNLSIVQGRVEQQKIDFKQQIYLQVAEFNMQQNQLYIAAKSDTIAQRNYIITKNRYYLGKISVTDLNIAQSSNDQARLNYLRAMQKYWVSYYSLRKNTLFDFKANKELDVDYDKILQ
jgi:outer membrane protein TolC